MLEHVHVMSKECPECGHTAFIPAEVPIISLRQPVEHLTICTVQRSHFTGEEAEAQPQVK